MAALEILVRVYTVGVYTKDKQNVPSRVKTIISGLSADDDDPIKLKNTLAKLTDIELTPDEAQEILTATNAFEEKQSGGWMLNSYVQSKLTQTAASNGISLTTSSNSYHVENGFYLPLYSGRTRWTYQHQPYATFVAPIAKIGFDSLRGSATDQLLNATTTGCPAGTSVGDCRYSNAVQALSRDVYRMMAFGGRLGFLGFAPTPNRAPELVSYVDVTYGRYDNYFTETYTGEGQTPTGYVRFPWRLDVIGVLKVPATPIYIGTELNKGTGPDSMSVYLGIRTDLTSLLAKLIPAVQ